MTITFEAATHTYRLDGRVVPHVTEIMERAGLTRWRGDLTDETARTRGLEVHRWCARYEWGAATLDEIPDAYRGYVASWAAFKAVAALKTEEVEMVVGSKIHGYAGRLDWVGRLNDRLTILDWKSGPPGPEAALQTAAYGMAYREMTGQSEHPARVAAYLQADGTIARLTQYTDWQDGARFLAALTVVQTRMAYGLITEETNGNYRDHPTD